MNPGVYLVGAGPGDPDLMTVKGMALLKEADVVVYDQLANPLLLQHTKDGCEKIYVGKKAGNHAMKQEAINDLLVELGRKHDLVVRLKGGDPYVFGRGGEEGEVLYEAGVPFEVVPGISSAIGGLAYAGIPITYRNEARSFHVITGHLSKDEESVDFQPLAKVQGTLVFLMGVGNLAGIVEGLLTYGKDPSTPVAIIYKASTPDQKVTEGTLSTIVAIAREEGVKPPSLIVVGEVIQHRKALDFFEGKPLKGCHILVTRAKESPSKMTEGLVAMGAKVTQLPTVRILPMNLDGLDQQIRDMESYDGLVFTSGVAVKLFFERLRALGLDGRHLHGLKIFAVGKETGKVLESHGIITDLIPEEFTKEGLRDLMIRVCDSHDIILMPRSARGDRLWLELLRESFEVVEVRCYDTVDVDEVEVKSESLRDVDYITFTSGSTVDGYSHLAQTEGMEFLSDLLKQAKTVAIGPITAKKLEDLGYEVDVQPQRYTIADMVQTIVEDRSNDMKE